MAESQRDFQKHFSELSDAALLEIERQDLVAAAAVFYDQEMTARGLSAETTPTGPTSQLSSGEELVSVVEFESADDAHEAQQKLKQSGIPAYIAVMVPAAFSKQAIGLLDPGVSEEELTALAESTPLPDEEKEA